MDRRIGKDIHKVSNKIRRQIDQIASKYDLTHSQYAIIVYIIKNKDRDVFQRDIEDEFSIRRSSVSAILSHLEKKGYIERNTVLHDARLKKITATSKAEKVMAESMGKIASFENNLMKSVTSEDLKIFYKVLDKLSEFVDENW